MPNLEIFLEKLRGKIPQIKPSDLLDRLDEFTIIDIRENFEVQNRLPGALHIPKGLLELKIHAALKENNDQKIVLYCAAGNRSLIASKSLTDMGLSQVFSLEGGFKAWIDSGFKTDSAQEKVLSEQDRHSATNDI